jgi:hypothetical protein
VKLKDIRQGLVRGAKKSNLVAFNERKIHRFGYELGDRALPTACRAGDDPDVVVAGIWLDSALRGPIGHRIRGRGRERYVIRGCRRRLAHCRSILVRQHHFNPSLPLDYESKRVSGISKAHKHTRQCCKFGARVGKQKERERWVSNDNVIEVRQGVVGGGGKGVEKVLVGKNGKMRQLRKLTMWRVASSSYGIFQGWSIIT